MEFYVKSTLVQNTPIYDDYWKFACNRQEVFFNRIGNINGEWTTDEILKKYKFTNAYRASDRVSQYLIKNVIYAERNYTDEDIIFRILLYKIFNKISTWEYIENNIGDITYKSFCVDKYNTILDKAKSNGKIYSAAYIMPPGTKTFESSCKHTSHLMLLDSIMKDNIVAKIDKAQSLEELYKILLEYPTIGPFLAFQYAIDINYSEICDFDEMSFVVAGPGAIRGINKCFIVNDKHSYANIIRIVAESQKEEFSRLGLEFKSLWGRELKLIDCQNLFCEIDKYTRVAYPEIGTKGKRIKQLFKPNKDKIQYFYPPKWKINHKLDSI